MAEPLTTPPFSMDKRTGWYWQAFNITGGMAVSDQGRIGPIVGSEAGFSHMGTGVGLNALYRYTSFSDADENLPSQQTHWVGLRPHYTLFKNPKDIFLDPDPDGAGWALRGGIPAGVAISNGSPQAFVGGSLEFLLHTLRYNSKGAFGGGTQMLNLGLSVLATPTSEKPLIATNITAGFSLFHIIELALMDD